MEEVLLYATMLTPIITALVQLIKSTFCLPKNVIPAISLIVGIIIGALGYPILDLDLTLRLWAGAMAGLSATGFFELSMNYRDGKTK